MKILLFMFDIVLNQIHSLFSVNTVIIPYSFTQHDPAQLAECNLWSNTREQFNPTQQ